MDYAWTICPFTKKWNKPKHGRSPIENSENLGNIADLGSKVSGGTIFMVNVIKRITGNLQRIILPHFGSVTVRIHYWRVLKPCFFMVLGPGRLDHDFQNQSFLILETPRYF